MTDLHTRINQPSKTLFSDSGELKRYKLIKIIVMKILPQDNTLSIVHEKEKIISARLISTLCNKTEMMEE